MECLYVNFIRVLNVSGLLSCKSYVDIFSFCLVQYILDYELTLNANDNFHSSWATQAIKSCKPSKSYIHIKPYDMHKLFVITITWANEFLYHRQT